MLKVFYEPSLPQQSKSGLHGLHLAVVDKTSN